MRVLALDIGKTSCRAAVLPAGGRGTAPGAPGLAEPGGVDAAFAAARAAIAGLDVSAVERVVVGAAGAIAAPQAAQELAERFDRPATVTSDAVLAHAGALGGAPGTVLVMGTGAVAIAIGDGLSVVDGAGPWLGDEGGGAWIGREGLRAAVRARDGRGPATALAPRRVSDAAGAASFAPEVARAAAAGDEVARRILEAAAEELARTARTAALEPVALTGGLLELGEPLLGPLRRRLEWVEAKGAPLDGALVIARGDTPHAAFAVTADGRAGPAGLDHLPTESVRPGLEDLDARPPAEIVALLVEAEGRAHAALTAAVPALGAAAEAIAERMRAGGRLRYAGAGTPGRIAVQDAAEIVPTFGTDPRQVVAVIAGGKRAVTDAVEGAEDDVAAGGDDLRAAGLTSQDAVVGISASGRTPYVVGALTAAREAGALTVAVTNAPGGEITRIADHAVEIATGAEVLAGSTRLSAGTTQKVALNAISTSAMIALGKAYGPRMVDLLATNEKLRRRSLRIVAEVTGAPEPEAAAALEAAGGHVKTAIVALLAGVEAGEARTRLERAGGRVRDAL
jgi:N-acetylmuramic acid 6-phosphate etherase